MILIVDNTLRKMRSEIRESLFKEGIPCAVSNTDNMDVLLPACAVIVTEKYILEDVEYISRMHEDSPIFLYNEDEELLPFVRNVCNVCCDLSTQVHRRIAFEEGVCRFCSRSLYLTRTEKRIVRMLLYLSGWQSANKISAYCLKGTRIDPKSVAVHICNINAKANAATGHDIIEHKRFKGYRITSF